MAKCILITGGAGFIGSHLSKELLWSGYRCLSARPGIQHRRRLGNTISLLELLDLIGMLHGEKPKLRWQDWRADGPRYYVSDTRKFKAATGWAPKLLCEWEWSGSTNGCWRRAAFPLLRP